MCSFAVVDEFFSSWQCFLYPFDAFFDFVLLVDDVSKVVASLVFFGECFFLLSAAVF